MSEAKHTPGPWLYRKGVTGWVVESYPDTTLPVCYTTGNASPLGMTRERRGENEANARLIAAAPELLEALQALTGPMDAPDETALTHMDFMVSLHWLRKARAAIAKAVG